MSRHPELAPTTTELRTLRQAKGSSPNFAYQSPLTVFHVTVPGLCCGVYHRPPASFCSGKLAPRMKTPLLSLAILVMLPHLTCAQVGTSRDYKVTVDVDLVVFNVMVTDSKGHLVKGLSKD